VRADTGSWGLFLLGASILGLIASLTIAGRIVFVAGRLKRIAKNR
jgi:hypothetical protein